MLWESRLESVPPRASLLGSELALSDKFLSYWQGFKSQKNEMRCDNLFFFSPSSDPKPHTAEYMAGCDVLILCCLMLLAQGM